MTHMGLKFGTQPTGVSLEIGGSCVTSSPSLLWLVLFTNT